MVKKTQFKRIGWKDTNNFRVGLYRKGSRIYEIPIDETDYLITVTTSPKRWFNKNLVVPIGESDEKGNPIYKVLDLKKKFRKNDKLINSK
ncbi:MAG: hypothetical protein HWN66_16780 [Candidatus Helarchaeota archaeon]|nr:hypothetical protein [Candidatus Helarchaeota archaeon]